MAIQFLPSNSYPINNENGFPVGQEIILVFDKPVDIKSVRDSFALYGPDFDKTSGPDNALWLNNSDATNPFFLKSPNFKGFVECDFKAHFVDNKTDLNILTDQSLFEKPSTEKVTVVIATPKKVLKENSEYNVFLSGENVDNLENLPVNLISFVENKAVSFQTIYSPYTETNNVKSLESRVTLYGSYEPKNNEVAATLNFEIVETGEGSAAKYIWWFSDEVKPLPAHSNYNNRLSRCVQRYRKTDRGVLIKFNPVIFTAGETFKVECYKKEFVDSSYLIKFQTSTDSIFTYPEATSESPIGLGPDVIPGLDSSSATDTKLRVVSISPINGDVNVDLNLDQIVIEFNKNLNASTVTQETVKLEAFPVSGSFDGPNGTRTNREYKIYKIISVVDNKIFLEL